MASGTRRVLVVFVDALGPSQLEELGSSLGFVPHRRALRGVLGYSSGALATLLTGAPPSTHGRMCLFARASAEGSSLEPLTALGLLPRVIHERAGLRRLAARLMAELRGLTGYVALHRVPPEAFAWLDLPERDDLFTTERIGGAATFLAQARAAGLSVYASPWQAASEARWAAAMDTLRRRAPGLTFLYAAELDGALHAHGNDSREARACAAKIAVSIQRARDALLVHGEVTTIVVGDHGMADVHRVVDPRGLALPASTRVFIDSTMLRGWGDASALDRTRLAIERARVPGVWLDDGALAARKAPVAGAPYGDALFLLDEGVIFAPSYVGGRARGMHGYDLDAASCHAALASDAPLGEVRELQDVAGLVRSALGVAA